MACSAMSGRRSPLSETSAKPPNMLAASGSTFMKTSFSPPAEASRRRNWSRSPERAPKWLSTVSSRWSAFLLSMVAGTISSAVWPVSHLGNGLANRKWVSWRYSAPSSPSGASTCNSRPPHSATARRARRSIHSACRASKSSRDSGRTSGRRLPAVSIRLMARARSVARLWPPFSLKCRKAVGLWSGRVSFCSRPISSARSGC